MTAEKTFEQSVAELEQVVRALEGGGLTLDDSLKAFEKGIALARECEQKLAETKGRIEMLIADAAGEGNVVPFSSEEGGA